MIGRRGGACLVGAVVLMCGMLQGAAWAGPASGVMPASASSLSAPPGAPVAAGPATKGPGSVAGETGAVAGGGAVAGESDVPAGTSSSAAREPSSSAAPLNRTAVERLQGQTAPASGPLELYPAWNAQLQAKPEPFQGALAMLEGGSTEPTGEAAPAATGINPWLFLVGGVVLGAVGMFIARRSRGKPKAAPWENVQLERPTEPASGSKEIQLISSQVLTDNGSVLVVNVCGERLVLGISGNRDYVTLLTKLGDSASAAPLDAEALGAMLRNASRPAPERAAAVRTPAFLSNTSAPEGAPPPDEELEVLLDELLGKVRGLKPLAKRADET